MSSILYRRVFFRIVGASVGYVAVAQMYASYKMNCGREINYTSRWYDELSNEEKEKVIKSRTNIVHVLRNLYEMKEISNKKDIFVENAIAEDPYMTMVGREEILKCFSLMPIVFNEVKTEKFEVQHLPKEIHISQQRSLGFKTPAVTQERSGMLVVKLSEINGEEKVASISDCWDNRPVIGPNNSFLFGYPIYMMRRVITLYMMIVCPLTTTGDILYDSTIGVKNFMLNDSEAESSDQKLLETPKPRTV
ncbi:uncharacterized protein LOC144742538 [Ciona intestinalis]